MEQLFTTPVRRDEIIVGKLVPYVGVGAIGVLLVLALGAWVFDVPIRARSLRSPWPRCSSCAGCSARGCWCRC
jgi:ABC-type Na+ efflux pump permease subunit